jgi:hypothetical protein
MAIAASGQGGVLVHVDPKDTDRLVSTTNAHVMEMRGREMAGWLRVDADHLKTKRQLEKWVGLGAAYARSLPAKGEGSTSRSRKKATSAKTRSRE